MDAEELVAGRYRLLEELGSGGVGTVRRARDTLLNRDVAIKEIRFPPQVTPAERQLLTERAIAEASAAARLNHPKIITVYDVVEHAARPWIVMQLVVGQSLERLIAVEGRLAPDAVALLGMELLDALEAAHAAGIVHRDVKPSNVLLPDSGGLLLTDFSIAKVLGADTNTLHGVLTGSPGYMAPERFVDGVTGPAADLFGLGATLYHAVEGRPPFDFENPMAGLFATATRPHPAPEHGTALTPVLDGLLAKDAAGRLTIDEARELLAPLARKGGLTDAATAGPSGAVSGLAAQGVIVPVWEIDAPAPGDSSAATRATPAWAPLAIPTAAVGPPPARAGDSRLLRSRRLRVAAVIAGALVLVLAAVVTAQAMSGDPGDDVPLIARSADPTEGGLAPAGLPPAPSASPSSSSTAPVPSQSATGAPAPVVNSPANPSPESTPSPDQPPGPSPSPARMTSFTLEHVQGNGYRALLTFDHPARRVITINLSYALSDGSPDVSGPASVTFEPGDPVVVPVRIQATVVDPAMLTVTATTSHDGASMTARFPSL